MLYAILLPLPDEPLMSLKSMKHTKADAGGLEAKISLNVKGYRL
jgi:hypothetical protein